MITIVAFYSKALDDFYYWESNDKKIFKRIKELIKDISRSPFEGTVSCKKNKRCYISAKGSKTFIGDKQVYINHNTESKYFFMVFMEVDANFLAVSNA